MTLCHRKHVACRYATPGGFRESALAAGLRGEDLLSADKQKQARHRMYTPGGPMARELAKNPTVLIVNDTLFAHGGVLKRHGNSLNVLPVPGSPTPSHISRMVSIKLL